MLPYQNQVNPKHFCASLIIKILQELIFYILKRKNRTKMKKKMYESDGKSDSILWTNVSIPFLHDISRSLALLRCCSMMCSPLSRHPSSSSPRLAIHHKRVHPRIPRSLHQRRTRTLGISRRVGCRISSTSSTAKYLSMLMS